MALNCFPRVCGVSGDVQGRKKLGYGYFQFGEWAIFGFAGMGGKA